ncbi:MAG: beta-N-acetylhexosaminidase [Promethearchaeota archaeon]
MKMKPVVSIIPWPVKLEILKDTITLFPGMEVARDESLEIAGEFLHDLLVKAFGKDIVVHDKKNEKNAAVIKLSLNKKQDPVIGREGYKLSISPKSIDIVANSENGVFNGLQTLRQLFPPEVEKKNPEPLKKLVIPCMDVVDYPRFKWRGFMLDVCRHFFDMPVIKQMLDALALLKMNVFHWHLTNDQGWRIEIKKYPKLIEIGSKRKESQIGGFMSKKTDGIPHEGYYSQEDVKGVIHHAGKNFITIIPEIEMPGHCMAALAAYPELSCTGGPFEVSTFSGIKKDVFCAGKEAVFEFLENVLDEVIELFPSKIIHVGGDEVPKQRWRECPDCQARMKKEGIKDEDGLQTYFINRIVKYLAAKGKQAMGWNEILDPKLDPSAIVQYWIRDEKKLINHLRKGRDAVMSHFFHVYLDYNHGVNTLKNCYNYNPFLKGLEEKYRKHVLGIEAPMWTEFAATPEHMQMFVFPRLVAIAENNWTIPRNKDFPSFKARLEVFLKRLDAMEISHASIKASQPRGIKRLYLWTRIAKQSSELPK